MNKFILRKIISGFFIFSLIFMLAIASGALDDIIFQLTGKTANWFTLGRSSHYMGLFEQLYNNPITIIFGNGVGSAYTYASVYYDSEQYRSDANLHSDILKIAFELGVVFFVFFFSILCRNLSYYSSLLIMYIVVLFLTDNILIYSGSMFILLILVLKINSDREERFLN